MNNFIIKMIKRESYKLKRCINFCDYFIKSKIYEELQGSDKNVKD